MTTYTDPFTALDDSDFHAPAPAPRGNLRDEMLENPAMFWQACRKCSGTGMTRWGKCFACNGNKGKFYKTSSADRAKARAQAAERKGKATAEWIAEHKALVDWLAITAEQVTKGGRNWDFPQSMLDAIAKYGSLTDNQLAAVEKLMARDAERKTERAAKAAAAPVVDASALQAAFDLAAEKASRPGQMGVWLKPLRLRAGEVDVTFSLASATSKNRGAIYAKRGETYLGKIQKGKFFAARECTGADTAAIAEACTDPAKAAVAYGKAWSKCGVCGQTLLNDASIERGIGPICAEKFGW